jgi:hypothetical protein
MGRAAKGEKRSKGRREPKQRQSAERETPRSARSRQRGDEADASIVRFF